MKLRKMAFLLAFHARIGAESSINGPALDKNSLFDMNVLALIFNGYLGKNFDDFDLHAFVTDQKAKRDENRQAREKRHEKINIVKP